MTFLLKAVLQIEGRGARHTSLCRTEPNPGSAIPY